MTEKEWKASVDYKLKSLKKITDKPELQKIDDPFTLMTLMPSGFETEIKYCYSEEAHDQAKEWISYAEPFLFFREKDLMLKILKDVGQCDDEHLIDVVALMIMSGPMVNEIITETTPNNIIKEVYKEIKTPNVLIKTKRFGLMLVSLQKNNISMFYYFYNKLPSKERRAEIWTESENEEVQHVIHICTLIACNGEHWDVARKLIEEQDGKIRVHDIGRYIEDELRRKYKDDKNYDFVCQWVEREIANRLDYFEQNVGKASIRKISNEEMKQAIDDISVNKEVIEDGIASIPSEEG